MWFLLGAQSTMDLPEKSECHSPTGVPVTAYAGMLTLRPELTISLDTHPQGEVLTHCAHPAFENTNPIKNRKIPEKELDLILCFLYNIRQAGRQACAQLPGLGVCAKIGRVPALQGRRWLARVFGNVCAERIARLNRQAPVTARAAAVTSQSEPARAGAARH